MTPRKKITRRKQSLSKQEALVSEIWDFARKQQYLRHDLASYPIPIGGEGDVRSRTTVTVNIQAVGDAVDGILKIFGYDKIEIQ